MSEYATTAAQELADVIARLAKEYPTDPDDAETVELQLTDGKVGPPAPVALQAGQLTWLTQLVERELARARNARSDGDGTCAHCEGTGSARPAGPVTHVAGWFPGDLLTDDPGMSGWELMTAEVWEAGHSADTWVPSNDPDATAEELLPLVAEMLAPHGPIRLTRSTYTIERVGRDEPGYEFKRGPWTFPLYEVTTLVPHQHAGTVPEVPADDGSQP